MVKFAQRCVKVWRKRFRIDKKWDISVVFSSEPDEEDPKVMCKMDDDSAQYWRMKLVFYPPILEYKADQTIRAKVNNTVCHELRHIFYWPVSSFAKNVLSERLWWEYLKHEEQLVTLDEEIFTNQKPRQGVRLTWGSKST
jgi:hypothetical protein